MAFSQATTVCCSTALPSTTKLLMSHSSESAGNPLTQDEQAAKMVRSANIGPASAAASLICRESSSKRRLCAVMVDAYGRRLMLLVRLLARESTKQPHGFP